MCISSRSSTARSSKRSRCARTITSAWTNALKSGKLAPPPGFISFTFLQWPKPARTTIGWRWCSYIAGVERVALCSGFAGSFHPRTSGHRFQQRVWISFPAALSQPVLFDPKPCRYMAKVEEVREIRDIKAVKHKAKYVPCPPLPPANPPQQRCISLRNVRRQWSSPLLLPRIECRVRTQHFYRQHVRIAMGAELHAVHRRRTARKGRPSASYRLVSNKFLFFSSFFFLFLFNLFCFY